MYLRIWRILEIRKKILEFMRKKNIKFRGKPIVFRRHKFEVSFSLLFLPAAKRLGHGLVLVHEKSFTFLALELFSEIH